MFAIATPFSFHLSLVVKDAVGFTADKLLATNDADSGKSLMGNLRDK